ncbi:uncharacterized protein [Apostichopus japonicus]|uniref:uncharacterized protein n=1 Tax=Stichopus japonicus TaxID=307972 RepID=UPI003AB3BA4E
MARGKGKSKSKAPAKKRPPKQRHNSAGLETPSQSGPQLNRPTERGPPAVGGSGPKERATEGSRRRSRSRSREPDREPERRVPTEIPARESRGRESSRRPRRERSGSHTISPRRRERKRYSPVSDESSDSSDGYRRAKRKPRSPRRRQEEEPACLSKLTGLLRPLLEQRTSTVADVAPGPTSPVPTMAPQPAPAPDALDCRASVNLSGLEDEGDPIDPDPLDYDPMEDSFGHNYEPEEAPVTGGALHQELITRAADIFRRHLGFEEPETQPQKAGRVSKLTSTGEASSKPKTTIPVDATCYDRFEAIANKTKWTAFPARADRAVRVPDEAWRDLFKCPTIPQEAKERLKAEQGASSTHVFKTPAQRKLEELLVEVDMAARSGMKFASVLMLSAEVLMRHHQQLPEDSSQVSRDEAGQLLLLLGPLVRLTYDQFARIATRFVKARRQSIVSAIHWPSTEAKDRMLELPILGEDLFAGCFQKKLQEEVARRVTLAKSEFRPPATQRTRPFRPRESRAPRGTRAAPAKSMSRGTLRGRSRGQPSVRPVPGPPEEAEARRRPDGTVTAPPLDQRSPPSPRGAHLTAAIPLVGGETYKLLPAMGIYWRGQVGVGHSQTRVQNRILLQPAFRGRRKADTHTHGPRQTLSSRRGNSGPVGQAGNYKSSGRDGTTLPVLFLSDQNTGRHLASHPKPKTPELKTHQTKTLPYGDLKLNITPTQKGHVGGERRLTGRLPAHLDTQRTPTIQDYQFRALPFGLATAPRVFTRVAGAVVAHLRKRGVTLYVYLDDWLVVGNSRSEATNNVHKTLQTLQELGWIVNQKKSRLSPSQTIQFLGAILDFTTGIARPSEERVAAV